MFKLTLALAVVLAAMTTMLAQDTQRVVPPGAVQNPPQADPSPAPVPAARPVLPEGAKTSAQLKVILLTPSIRFEDVHSGTRNWLGTKTPATSEQKGGFWSEEEYERILLNAARGGAGSKVTLLDTESLEPSVVEAFKKLDPLVSRLARGNVNPEAIEDLAGLAALDPNYAVLVQFFRLEMGPGRSWDPNTGAITSSADSTLIQAALVSGKTGRVIWKGERLVRNKALKPTDAALSKTLTEMYRDFDIK